MEIKILQVFYDKNGLPYKDKERTVHYPITSGTFLGSSNTTQIRFYYDQLDELNESTFIAISKLPNGRIGSEILKSEYDSELEENYAVLNLSQFYTQYKGDVYISLQGYEGGVRVEQDENGIYSIIGTPTIQATGSIRMYVAYAPTFIGSGQTENVTLQRVLAELSTKLGIRQETLHVEELPTVGNPNVWYVVNDDPNDTTKANIYIWNAKTQTYVWVGDNTLDLGEYYTKEQGDQFESDVNETLEDYGDRIEDVESELSSVAQGSPKGVYATLAALQAAHPTGADGIYVVQADGHWYYWNGSAWTDGGTYLSSPNVVYYSGTRLEKPNGDDLFPDVSGLPFYPNVRIGQEISFTISSGNIIVNLPTSPNQLFYQYGGKCYFVNLSTSSYTIPNFYALIFDYDDRALYIKNFNTNSEEMIGYSHQYCILLLNDNGNIKGLWENYYKIKTNKENIVVEKNERLSNPVMVATVSPRTSYDDELVIEKSGNDLIVNLPVSFKQLDFIRNGVFYSISYSVTQLTIPNYSALVFNFASSQLEIKDVNSSGSKPLENYNRLYYILLYNDNGYPKGEWSKYYQYNKFNEQISALGHIKQTTKIMSRQGEGYGYPDNSIEGVSAALKDGYDNVRISVAHTSDNVIYCTHSYEMQNNSTLHVLTIGGDAYNDNVDINSSTSTFIDTLKYKGYTIPKLADMMNVISKNAKQVTFELKDSWDNTTLQQLINISKYYSVEVVFSMSIDSTPTLLTNLDDNLNIALIFHYTDALAQTLYNSYKNKAKSIRFDCYYEDTISFNSVITYIHPLNKLKLGGSSITSTELKSYLTYVDIVEYSGKISEIGLLS